MQNTMIDPKINKNWTI